MLCKCGCGEIVAKRSYETNSQWTRREKLGIYRAKCKKSIPAPVKKERITPTLDASGFVYERPELVVQEKEKIPRSEKYKKFIREQPCLLLDCEHGPCDGDVIPHHTDSGGMSIKGSDLSCVPLCNNHHHLMDNAGKKGNGIWTRQQLGVIIIRLNEEFNWQLKYKEKRP